MARLDNNFDGGTDNTAMSTGNTGGDSGDAFNAIDGTQTSVFDDAWSIDDPEAAAGLSALFTSDGSGGRVARWTSAWTATTETWFRAYCKVADATPNNNSAFITFLEADDATSGCDVQLGTGGNIRLRAPATLRYTSTKTFSDGEEFRIEVHVVSSATVGHIECRLFYGDNLHGTSPDEQFGNLVDNWDTGAALGGVAFGWGQNPGAANSIWFVRVALSDVDWIGPAYTPATDKLATPTGFTFVATPNVRELVATCAAVENADDGYNWVVEVLDPGGSIENDEDWSAFADETTAEPELTLTSDDGVDYSETYRCKVRALTSDDNA